MGAHPVPGNRASSARSTASPAAQGTVNLEGIRFAARRAGRRRRSPSSCIRRPRCSCCRCRGRWRAPACTCCAPAAAIAKQRHAADHGEGACSTSAPTSATRRRPGATSKVVLCGWSGGGSLALFYQAQAERPTITRRRRAIRSTCQRRAHRRPTRMIFQAAHVSRAACCRLDRSLGARRRRSRRARPRARHLRPAMPEPAALLRRLRPSVSRRQLARMRRADGVGEGNAREAEEPDGGEMERGFVTHRTMGDPRFIDPAIDPNDRKPRWMLPRRAGDREHRPGGHRRASRPCAPGFRSGRSTIPTPTGRSARARSACRLLAIENSADDAVPQPHARIIHDAAASTRQDVPRDQGRDPLLPGPAGAAAAGGGSLCRMDGQTTIARLRRRVMSKVLAVVAFALSSGPRFSQQTIKIGVITDEVGAVQAVLGARHRGRDLRRRRDQPRGGLLGRKIELLIEDDQVAARHLGGAGAQAGRRRARSSSSASRSRPATQQQQTVTMEAKTPQMTPMNSADYADDAARQSVLLADRAARLGADRHAARACREPRSSSAWR